MFLVYKENYLMPEKPPFRIVLSDGGKRTDPDSFTEDELVDAGYKIAPPKPRIIPRGMSIGWDRENEKWIVVGEYDKPLDSFDWFKENKKMRDVLLEEIEVTRLRLIEQDADMTEFNEYIDALNNVNLSTQNVAWPQYNPSL